MHKDHTTDAFGIKALITTLTGEEAREACVAQERKFLAASRIMLAAAQAQLDAIQ